MKPSDPIFDLKWILHNMGDGLAGTYWVQCGPRCHYVGATEDIAKRNKNGTDFSKNYNDRVKRAFKKHGATNFMFIKSTIWYYVIEGIFLEQFEEMSLKGDKTIANQKPSFGSGGNTCTDRKARAKASEAGGGKEAKPYELRDAKTHKLIHPFASLNKEEILGHFKRLKAPESVQNYLNDATCRGDRPLCFYNFGVLVYICYQDETIEELEKRTGRCLQEDILEKTKCIPDFTVRSIETGDLIPVRGCKSYADATKVVGIPYKQRGRLAKLALREAKSCSGLELVI